MFAIRAVKHSTVLLIATSFALSGCNSSSSSPVTQEVAQKREQPPAPIPEIKNSDEPNAKASTGVQPPKLAEVEEVVKRVFKDAAILDISHEPYFFVGDFNGDNAQDIALVIKPVAGKLSEMNQDNPPWMLRDPFNPNLPPQLRTQPLRVGENDSLLAIVHGFGGNGWRSAEATQTYLLKDGVGTNMQVLSAKMSLVRYSSKKRPTLSGDTISQSLRNTQGFLYYLGANYGWYDPNTFAPEAERRMAHPGIPTKQLKPKDANTQVSKDSRETQPSP